MQSTRPQAQQTPEQMMRRLMGGEEEEDEDEEEEKQVSRTGRWLALSLILLMRVMARIRSSLFRAAS
jgi:hypothetical protein